MIELTFYMHVRNTQMSMGYQFYLKKKNEFIYTKMVEIVVIENFILSNISNICK